MKHSADYSHFWDSLQPGQVTKMLMDMLPDTITAVKNLQGVYIHVNKAFTKTTKLEFKQIIGKTDFELFGAELSSSYTEDDNEVMSRREPIYEKSELVTHRPGIVRWYLTSKIPLADREGNVMGVAVLSKPSQAHRQSTITGAMASLSKAVDFIYENSTRMITVDMLSSYNGISISTLERSFKTHFNCSPGKFITQVKVSKACELLAEQAYSIGEVSDQLGYSDPVVFTRIFKREMKISPSEYRKSLKSPNNSLR